MHELIMWLVNTIGAMGYSGIFLLMAMESSVIPVPSELVMPPAGYLAQQGQMNIWAAILMGTVGSLVGAYANYFAAHYLGRPLLLKYGKYVWITEEKFAKVEQYFKDHGEISTFIDVPEQHVAQGRLPAIAEPLEGRMPMHIHSGRSRPGDAYAAIEYRGYWYWIEDTDYRSKRLFTFMMIMLSLAETGTTPGSPLFTVSAGG